MYIEKFEIVSKDQQADVNQAVAAVFLCSASNNFFSAFSM